MADDSPTPQPAATWLQLCDALDYTNEASDALSWAAEKPLRS